MQVAFIPAWFIALVYNSGTQNYNVLINDRYACLHVLGKQLYVWNVYNLSLLGYSLVIAGLQLPYSPAFPLIHLCTGVQFL